MANLDLEGKLFVGTGESPQYLALPLGKRHGLVTGATGTGKTVTLESLAAGVGNRVQHALRVSASPGRGRR